MLLPKLGAPPKRFEYKGENFTLEQLQQFAVENNVDFGDFMNNMSTLGMVEAEKASKINTDVEVNNALDFLQAAKQTPLPGATGTMQKFAASGVQSIFGLINGIYDSFTTEDTIEEKDPYASLYFVDLGHDLYRSFMRDYKDTEDTEAALRLQEAIAQGREYDEDDIIKFTENSLEVAKMGLTDEARSYQAIYDKNKEKYNGFTAFFMALGQNPSFALQTTVGSFGRMAGTAINSEQGFNRMLKGGVAAGTTAAVASPFAAPVSIPVATLAGMFGTLSGTMEQASTFQQLIQEQLEAEGKKFTAENVRAFLQNDEVVTFKDPRLSVLDITGTRAEIVRRRSINRGLAIGFIDAASTLLGGAAVSRLGPTATKKTIGIVGSTTAIGGGLASETAGQIAGGQKFEIGEILLEGIAEKAVAMTGITTAPRLLQKKAVYEINGQKNLTEQEFLNELNKMTDEEIAANQDRIKVENDNFTKNRFLRRANIGTYMSQISPNITNEQDRRRLANKQMELDRLRLKNKNKKESSRDKKLDDKIKSLQEEINNIIETYDTQPQIAPETELDAQRTKEKVKQARFNFLKNEILKNTKNTKAYKSIDISTDELSADEAVNQFIEQEGANLLYDLSLLNANLEAETDAKVKRQIRKKIKEVEQEYNALEQNAEEARTSHGFLLEDNATGKMKIIINSDMALADGGNINVAAHEFLHAVLRNVFLTETGFRARELKGVGVQTGQKLLDFLTQNNEVELLYGGQIVERLKSYQAGDIQGQEVLTLLSDAMVDMNYNSTLESGFAAIGQRISELLQAYLPERFANKLNFADGKQVFNFIKTFNKAIQGDKVAGRIIERVRRGGFKIDESTVEKKEKGKAAKAPMSKAASDRVQNLYEQEGVDGAFQIIEQFKPITTRIARRYRDVPGYDEQLLIDEIETGRRGIYDMIANEYNSKSGVPLAAYINKFLPARAIEAANRILDTEFTQDVTEVKGLAVEETTQEQVESTTKPKEIVLASRLKVSDKVTEKIKTVISDLNIEKLNFKNLKNQVPEIIGELFGIAPKKLITNANITKKELQSAQMFINKNADLLIAMLPEGATASGTATGVPNTLLKAFYTKTDRAKAATTGSKAGLAIQQKNDINKKDFLEVFGIIDGKPDRTDRNTSARVLAIANTLGKMITNQEIRKQSKTIDISKDVIQSIEDGKSSVMFSHRAAKNFSIKNNLPVLNFNESIDMYKVYIEKMRLLSTYMPGIIRRTDLYNFGLSNPIVKKYAREETLNYGDTFVISKATATKFGIDFIDIQQTEKYVRPDTDLGKSINKITKEKAKKYNKIGRDNFETMWDGIKRAIKDNPDDKMLQVAIYYYLSSSVNDTSHPNRTGALYVGGDITATGKIIYEHALQSVNVFNELLEAIIDPNQNFEERFEATKNNYYLIAMSEKDAKAIDKTIYIDENGVKQNYKTGMGLNWNVFDNKWFQRYFNFDIENNPNVNIDPSNFEIIETGKTFAEEFNITSAGFKPGLQQNGLFSKSVNKSRLQSESKGITILDFDDTLATTNSLVRFTAPDGTTGTLNAEQYASTYQDLQERGYKFDFSEFNKVVDGKIAPLFQKALKLQRKFGPENMFVLTARPPESAKAIFQFLKANGLNIPLKNITGLANSTSEAKALWIAEKVGEGYNDFYFADDALQNVQAVDNMLEQFDVKRKVQQAKAQFSKPANLDKTFNNILENVTGIESKKRFGVTKARKRGANKGKFRLFIPPSHEDFTGLLYNFMGKGKQGDSHRDFFEQSLIKPLNRGYRELDTAKQAIANDYKSLNKKYKDVKKMFTKKTPDGDFTYEDAIRVYIWDKHGYDIPGLSEIDQKKLVDLIKENANLQAYAEAINIISKQDTYVDPQENWDAGNIRIDLIDAVGRVGRKQYFQEFQENADIIFSEENLNKIEAAYGASFRSALEDMLYRIQTGINRPKGQSATVNSFMNYLNGSVGTVMFFNIRSAILQQMSIVNYINFADNNVFAAAKAFANQPQYWRDFAFIFNSDMLKQRRGGIQTDINGAELAEAVKKSKKPIAAVISKLLQLGFLPTQIGDNIAIAVGGATFYRNRINKYIKDGMSKAEAEAAAFTDFQDITQSTQQSARPDKSSQQQAMWIGKLVLNFQNITSQYNRIIKRAAQDIYNRRISPPYTNLTQSNLGNISKILYYGAIQNVIFYSLQTALFYLMFEDKDDEDEKANQKFLDKKERVINGTIDSILRGSGIYGVAASTVKNMAIKWFEQREAKGFAKDESAVLMEALNFSPVVGIKARKLVNAEKTINYNENVISEMETFEADNPQWSAVTNYIEAFTNFPANRLYQKSINVRNALDNNYTAWQRFLFFSGYTTWSLGLGESEKVKKAKEKIKADKKAKEKIKSRSSRKKRKTRK